ncbi:DUF262 domain-containing protein [Methylobacterium brachiatum]|uniref:DUF262 domain-containing protein n=1 Tax=Methylobacterium brachiatum TaxID=269660 RepID=UPI002446B672|nr:DUF262 domain-containing protein [Methylobacterium brachiatum]MDH2314001.1 DUF262 domain-containing protein [Methylobacterium brachiatum]
MSVNDNFLHTTHRTVAWFKKTASDGQLLLKPPFQRNMVWTDQQKSYLIETILKALPIPELYMQDVGDETGLEKHVLVDGQQRIGAVLEFLEGEYSLGGDEIERKYKGLKFEDLEPEIKKGIYSYKFVVRILPPLDDEEVRRIFARINKNAASLNDQEIRNATYWGKFISTIQKIVDDDDFWSEFGVFSANDHRRMLDHEFVSELAVAYLHGPQNKKDRLDSYYLIYEEEFPDQERLKNDFYRTTSEIRQIFSDLKVRRWKKKSDFYTMFLGIAKYANELPWSSDKRDAVRNRILEFGDRVEAYLARDAEGQPDENVRRNSPSDVAKYAENVNRAASDKANRIARAEAFDRCVIHGDTDHYPNHPTT